MAQHFLGYDNVRRSSGLLRGRLQFEGRSMGFAHTGVLGRRVALACSKHEAGSAAHGHLLVAPSGKWSENLSDKMR